MVTLVLLGACLGEVVDPSALEGEQTVVSHGVISPSKGDTDTDTDTDTGISDSGAPKDTAPPDPSEIDEDGDGYMADVDCDDDDPDIHPDAEEVCGDGDDNDCDALTSDDCPGDTGETGDTAGDVVIDTSPPEDTASSETADTGIIHTGDTGVIVIIEDRCVDVDDCDGDGYLLLEDCDDERMLSRPDGTEACTTGRDEDCDGLIDHLDPDHLCAYDIIVEVEGGTMHIELSGNLGFVICEGDDFRTFVEPSDDAVVGIGRDGCWGHGCGEELPWEEDVTYAFEVGAANFTPWILLEDGRTCYSDLRFAQVTGDAAVDEDGAGGYIVHVDPVLD